MLPARKMEAIIEKRRKPRIDTKNTVNYFLSFMNGLFLQITTGMEGRIFSPIRQAGQV